MRRWSLECLERQGDFQVKSQTKAPEKMEWPLGRMPIALQQKQIKHITHKEKRPSLPTDQASNIQNSSNFKSLEETQGTLKKYIRA